MYLKKYRLPTDALSVHFCPCGCRSVLLEVQTRRYILKSYIACTVIGPIWSIRTLLYPYSVLLSLLCWLLLEILQYLYVLNNIPAMSVSVWLVMTMRWQTPSLNITIREELIASAVLIKHLICSSNPKFAPWIPCPLHVCLIFCQTKQFTKQQNNSTLECNSSCAAHKTQNSPQRKVWLYREDKVCR